MNPQTAKYYVILVHFGLPEPTNRAIHALFSGKKTPTEVVVINHAHQPYSWPKSQPVTILRPRANLGYGAGVNIGLGFLLKRNLADQDVIIVMNNDVVVSSTTFPQLTVPPLTLVGVRGGRVNWFTGRTEPDKEPPDYINGAFLAATWETWGKLSGMPEEYFLYWEDVASSIRARQRGLSLVVMPELKVEHQPSHQHQPTDNRLYYLVKGGAYFMEHNAPWLWRLFWWLKNRLRYLYHRFFSSHPQAHVITRALRDAIKS